MKGFKVFDPDFKCKGHQYAENTEYKMDVKPEICSIGFHFCLKAQHCFSYYSFNPQNIVCEVEALGETVGHHEDTKIATNHIKIGRRLSWQEVLVAANDGMNNTGYSNSGNCNSGNWNSGYRNSGDWNSGNWNSGYRNSGNWNSGDGNSGDSNSGDMNSGDGNSGDRNSGDWNSGDRNSGDRNSGDRNSGDSNSGDRNSGYWNSGNWNSGYWNSGNWNSGDRNSGDCNSGYRNSGAFCTDPNPEIYLFNKPTKLKVREWENHKAVQIMRNFLVPTIWIPFSMMNEEEKKANPKAETTGGYLKTIPMKEAWINAWGKMSDENKKVFTALPNFDPKVFQEITSIDVTNP